MKQLIQQIASQLQAAYPADEAEALAWWIAEETTGLSRTRLLCGCKGTKNISNLQDIINRLLLFEPIQYIFGHMFWCGLDLRVTPATLIPRPETAELVERLSNFKSKISNLKSQIRVLDVGTGSGCIALALKKQHPDWQVTGIDISAEAIQVARENARRNKLDVEFLQMDIFSDSIDKNQYDIVVSNPPYICEREKAAMRDNVLRYEPAAALFVPDDDPLRFYRRIASLHLAPLIFFEFNEHFPAQMEALLREEGYTDIVLTHDSYGKPRIIEGRMAE